MAVQRYVAYSTSDALSADPRLGSVDAIVAGTPWERVEYASFVAAFEGVTATPGEIDAAATPATIDIVLFAHSRDPQDQGFLRRFRDAVLVVGGVTLRPVSTSIAGPTEDFFNTPAGREFLWMGDTALRFDLHGLPADVVARFSVTDPYGRKYSVRLDLSKYV